MPPDEELSPDSTEAVEEPDISFFAKLAGVLLDPRKTFRAVSAHPQWVAPILILMGVVLVFAILTRPVIVKELESGKQMQQLIEQRNMTQEQAAKAIEIQKKFASIGILVSAPLSEVATCLVFAVILLFVGNVILGGAAKFVAIFSAYAWARLITIIGTAAKIPLVLSTKTIQVTLSPAILLPGSDTGSLMYAVLSVFDIFHIWEAVLVCFAMAAVYKITLQRSVGFVGTIYVVLAAVGILLRELFPTGGV
jgi:hypothetical protein